MGNTTMRIPQIVKLELVKRIQKMLETRNKWILQDAFVHEMSCKQVADSMRYYSSRGKPISVRMVQIIVRDFYPDYYNIRKKDRFQNKARMESKDFKFEIIAERGCKCEKCGVIGKYLELHHITPIAFGGETTKENVLLVCEACHKTLTSEQQWGEHHKGWLGKRKNNEEVYNNGG